MAIYFKKDRVKDWVKNYMSLDNLPQVQGYNFENEFNFDDFMKQFIQMGFQGSNLGNASNILKAMLKERKNGLKIWLSCTGNMISSGNREIITFLLKHNIIAGITTTAAAIEEDIIKCIKPFHVGSYDVRGKYLYDECIGRIGNIFVPYDRYLYLEEFINDFYPELMKKIAGTPCTSDITRELGQFVKKHSKTHEKHEESFLFWAAKNKVPVFCPGITDGALGDMTVFFRQKHPDFAIDVARDHSIITEILQNTPKIGAIILGGGIAKHYLLNAAIFREGMEYCIYLTTATEFDGSDSGGNQEEAISWAKIKADAHRVKVIGDASILFPLLIASTIKEIKSENSQ